MAGKTKVKRNVKVKNATESVCDGIRFKSILEASFYTYLKEHGYCPVYEPQSYELIEEFGLNTWWFRFGKKGMSKQRSIVYTPDFIFSYKQFKIYLEVKGFETDRFPMYRKLFLRMIADEESSVFIEARTVSDMLVSLQKLDELCEKKTSKQKRQKTAM